MITGCSIDTSFLLPEHNTMWEIRMTAAEILAAFWTYWFRLQVGTEIIQKDNSVAMELTLLKVIVYDTFNVAQAV